MTTPQKQKLGLPLPYDTDAIRVYLNEHFVPHPAPPAVRRVEAPAFQRVCTGAAGMFIAEKPAAPKDMLLLLLEREITENCMFPRSFYAKLCEYVDRRGYKSDAEFYKAAGISRQSFSPDTQREKRRSTSQQAEYLSHGGRTTIERG